MLDKWFQIQATVPGPGAVEAVAALMEHPAFSLSNPNRVRSLVGTFASANQTGFHRADGAGYKLFSEIVLAVDKHNPQVAARLATVAAILALSRTRKTGQGPRNAEGDRRY